ncbi:Ger(x)C family spore germination protein [Aquibacillus kalidii]|uniref:Ger(x)C family spore germination protein n=1 Tax=Aquibacillus kalidii TaxID=2762597 RepID=UPI001646D197|nr:Ger(x)C family spore germination protein [Aquibacillus kalidii]
MRLKTIILIIMLIPLFLVGCYDKKELEQQAYVVAIGVDKTDEKGLYKFTFQIANPEVGSAIVGGGSQEEPKETVSIKGSDILTATNTANSFVSREITLDHTKVLIASEELARSGDFIRIMQSTARTTQIRRGVQILVSKEDASEFLQNINPKMETRPHKYYQLILDRAKETGIIPEAEIHRFFQITEGDADLFLAIYATNKKAKEKDDGYEDEYVAGQLPKEGGNNSQFMGSAVFKEGKMIGTLDGQETRLAHVFDPTLDMDDLLSTYPDPIKEEFRIGADYSQKSSPEINIEYNKNKPTKINVRVPFQIEIIAIPSLVDYSQNKDNKELLKKTIEESLEKKSRELIRKTQEEYKAEPFYWSLYIRKYFKTIEEYEEADWNKNIYPNAEININFDLERLEFGKMLNDSNLTEVRD